MNEFKKHILFYVLKMEKIQRLVLEKIEQRKLKVGCNFTDYMSEIALGVVKFVRFFNSKKF